MATSSFNKHFVIRDKKVAKKFRDDYNKEHKVIVKSVDLEKQYEKGVELLKKYLSR
jgi:hypothetical protein